MHKNYEKYQFCTKDIQRILSSQKDSEKYKEREVFFIKSFTYYLEHLLNISLYSQENTCVGASF